MNYSNLMDAVNARIKANGRREITGDILNDVLRAMVVELGAGYQLGGTIRPGDKLKDEDLRVAYLAVEPGMYLYAGGFEVTELSLITYGAEWYMYPLGVPFGSQIAEDIAAAVEVEKTRAMAAEKDLSDAIATEERERAAADSALDSAIKAEAKRATDAEGVLAKAVADEKTRAMAAEGANASAIASEADAREQADSVLQGNISAEADAREAADEALAAKVTAEETARKAADTTLQANINTEESERKAADTALGTRVTNIEDKIPAQATAENKLADKDFVNSSIATSTATFRGTFDTLEALKAAQADKNDYAFWVHKDEDGNTCYDKYTYTDTEWKFEYRLNNSSFTAAQWAALNSGVTADVIKALQDADKANAKAIADEKAERIAAVAAETTAREQADTANAEAITTETAGRKAADQTLQGNIDKKQDTISDLATIRTQAAHGQTAFSWGDHAKAGYTKAFIINLSVSGSGENPFVVDKTHDEVAAALAANNLILLKANLPDYSEIYSLIWAQNYPTEGIMLRFGYIDKANLAYATIEMLFSYQEGVNVTVSSIMLATDEQVKAKQDALVSGKNIKTINGESVVGAGDLKVGGLPFVINLTGDGSNEHPYAIDKTFDEIVAAYHAKSLILLSDGLYFYPATPSSVEDGHVYLTFAVVWVDNNILWAYYINATAQEMNINRFDFGYIISGSLATINGKSVESGGDIKVGEPPIILGYKDLEEPDWHPVFANPVTKQNLTNEQVCALLNGVDANRVMLKNLVTYPAFVSPVKILRCNMSSNPDMRQFIIGFEGAHTNGQIYDIIYRWDARGAKVLRAEVLADYM